jgi:hypothetical protein
MKGFSLVCEKCGSSRLRRSHRQSLADFAHIAQGQYPVRCLDCKHRFLANLLQFEKIPFAKCPKCFNLDLVTAPQQSHHSSLWRTVLLSLGAHRYRCSACRYNFLSFRFRDPGTDPQVTANDTANRKVQEKAKGASA